MENKKKNLTLSEEIRFGRRTQGRFSAKPHVGPILHPINPPKYFSLFRRQENLGLENQKVCEILGISVRTLQTCRDKWLLSYSCIKYKIFYKPEDVEAFLKLSYHQQNRVK